ncbi:hypothetical protein BVRB_3g054140 [Beta vulgaris subsp. vulgaris]|nr:hypothetical protein BVRB_3g054140 [Beta vulgaris subsp. vulgaris]
MLMELIRKEMTPKSMWASHCRGGQNVIINTKTTWYEVAEMANHEELVGVVRGCIKKLGFSLRSSHLKMGCILGLRVSPRHRQMGVGLNLMKAIEEWLTRNGAEYMYLATEENNAASRNLFTLKCQYKVLSPLQIYVLPIDNPLKKLSSNVYIEKLQVNQAVSFYKYQLKCKDLYPDDIEAILRGNPSLGTWVCYFNDEVWEGLHVSEDQNTETIISTKPSSWIVFSLWNSREVYKLQIRRFSHFSYFLHAALTCVSEVISPCIKLPLVQTSSQKPFGFLFLYGLLGEGNRLRELNKTAWNFAAKLAKDADCKLVMTEVGDSDPLKKHIPSGSSMLSIKDLWYFKNTDNVGGNNEEITMALSGVLGNVFVDPRDF